MFIYLNCEERYKGMIDHRSLKPEKNLGLNRIATHGLCNAGAVLCQLSYQAIWEMELVTL